LTGKTDATWAAWRKQEEKEYCPRFFFGFRFWLTPEGARTSPWAVTRSQDLERRPERPARRLGLARPRGKMRPMPSTPASRHRIRRWSPQRSARIVCPRRCRRWREPKCALFVAAPFPPPGSRSRHAVIAERRQRRAVEKTRQNGHVLSGLRKRAVASLLRSTRIRRSMGAVGSHSSRR
jgi:hypothetical protein